MALQIWLPLNGNLNNQGLNGNIISSNNYTSNANGKIGSCIKTSSSNHIDLGYNGNIINDGSISFGGWFKFNKSEIQEKVSTVTFSDTGTTPTGNLIGNGSYSGIGLIWSGNNVYSQGSFNAMSVFGYIRTGNTGQYNTNSFSITFDTWTHIFLTFDKATTTMKLYVNGTLIYSKTRTAFTDAPSRNLFINYAAVYGGNGPGINIPYYINDVRVYDHCLSDKEVKEISTGLILHYKLSENYQTLNNCYSYPTFNTSSANGGWSHWAPSNNTGSYSQNTNREYIFRDSQTYSHYFEHSSGNDYYICYQTPAFEGGYRSAQAIIKMPNGEDPRGHIAFSHNANVGTNPPTTFTQLENGFWLMKHEGFQQDGSNDLVSIYITHNKGVYVSEAYLENNKQVCSDIFTLHDGKIVDCSGYGRNGELYGSVTSSADTPRYNTNPILDGGNTAIKIGNLSTFIHDGIFTFNVWFNVKEFGTKSWGTIFGGPSGFEFQSKRSSTNSPSLVAYSWGQSGSGGQTYDLDKWNMVTMVRTPSNCKFYLNGSLYYTGSAGSIPSGNYFLGSWRDYSSQNYKGMFSDARIYATALSDNDIKELYSVGASIDNKDTVHCYQLNENNLNLCSLAEYGIATKQWIGRLSKYTQTNCQCTLTDTGYRIYRPANKTVSGDGNTMWGGFVLDNGEDNYFGFQDNHTYMLQFEVKGKTSNAVSSIYWTNLVGWGGGGLDASPSSVKIYNPVTANYQSDQWKTFTYIWTINDGLYKTCTSAYAHYVAGNRYMSYKGFKYGFDYTNTGTLGTDLYIKNVRIYDITNGKKSIIYKSGIVDMTDFVEEEMNSQIVNGSTLVSKQFIEY